MKEASQVALKLDKATINNVCKSSITSCSGKVYNVSEEDVKTVTALVLNLFSDMKYEFGALFEYKEHLYDAVRAKEWALEILDEGITLEEFQKGAYKAIKKEEYPIERAFTFIKLCKDVSTNQFPDVRESYLDATQNKYSHSVAYETARRVGFWELKSKPENSTYSDWKIHYKKACNEYLSGVRFELPKSKRIGNESTPIQEGTEFSKKVDDFISRFIKKHKRS